MDREPDLRGNVWSWRSTSTTIRTRLSTILNKLPIVTAAELSDRYITGRFLPDKAIDLIDQTAARVSLRSKTKPVDTRELEDEIGRLKREKDQAVSAEDFEKART